MRRKRTKREELEREEIIRRMLQDGYSEDEICEHPKVDMYKGNLKRKIKLMEKQGKLAVVTHNVDTSKLDAIDEQIEKIESDLAFYEKEQEKEGLSLKENLAITDAINRLRREKRLAEQRRDKLVLTPTQRVKTEVKKPTLTVPEEQELNIQKEMKRQGKTREQIIAEHKEMAFVFLQYLKALKIYANNHNMDLVEYDDILAEMHKQGIKEQDLYDYIAQLKVQGKPCYTEKQLEALNKMIQAIDK